MKVFWIGGVAEKKDYDEMIKNGNIQIAANVTQLNYIEGIEKNINKGVKILSSHFHPSYPKYKKMIIKRRTWNRNNTENIDIGFLNLPIIKHFIKSWALKKEIKKILKYELDDKDENIFFIYAMTFPLMSIAPIIKRFSNKKNIKICLIVPDLPEFMNMNKKNFVRKIFEYINEILIGKYLKFIDYFVLFAQEMANYLKLEKNYITVEGMVNLSNITGLVQTEKKKVIMYAGGLNEKYGVLNLVKAFNLIDSNGYELWLYGVGDALERILEFAEENKNIKYKGMVSNEEIVMLEKQATLLVNPRPTKEEYTKYSFPSKNLEYMLSGTPLLTTKLPAMPKEYYDYIYMFENDDVDSIKKTLENVIKISEKNLVEKGTKASEFVANNKNNVVQTKRILDMLD